MNARKQSVPSDYQALQRRERQILDEFVRALSTGDLQALGRSFKDIELRVVSGWRRAFQRVTRLSGIDFEIRQAFVRTWIADGAHIRAEVGDDLLLARGLRVLLPPYEGPPLVLYRGESASNRRYRGYGLSWSSERAIAESYAAKGLYRTFKGGSVLLQAKVPARGIIYCVPAHHDCYGETEYLVDRRFLKKVKVLQRYSPLSIRDMDLTT